MGTGDGISPMDLINPLEYAGPGPTGRADNRLPVWLFSGTVSGNGISFEGVLLPKAEVNALPAPAARGSRAPCRELRRQRDGGLFTITAPRRTGQMVPGCGIRRAPLRQSRGVGSGAHGLPRFLSTTRCS